MSDFLIVKCPKCGAKFIPGKIEEDAVVTCYKCNTENKISDLSKSACIDCG